MLKRGRRHIEEKLKRRDTKETLKEDRREAEKKPKRSETRKKLQSIVNV
jgi:hypothetical protein